MDTCIADYLRNGIKMAWACIRLLCETWEPVEWWKSKRYKLQKDKVESRKVFYRGGVIRSSEEVAVMAMERRDNIILLDTENN